MLETLWNDYQRSDFIVTFDDGKYIQPDFLSKQYRKIISKTNYKGIRYHDLRHTAGSLMLLEGYDLKTVSEILGHSSIKITADIYLHIVNDMKLKALSSLDKYMTQEC